MARSNDGDLPKPPAHDDEPYPLFESMALPAILLDLEGKALRANLAAQSWWPLSDGQVCLPAELASRLEQMTEDAEQRGRAISEMALNLAGHASVLELNATLIPSGPGLVLVTLFDITAQVAIAEQLELARDEAVRASMLKSQFVANMSHEIRTPLNGIVGMLELLSLTPLTRQQEHFVKTGRQSARLLFQLIEDILDFSRIEAGKVALNPEVTVLQHVINRAIQPAAIAAESKGLELLVSFDPKLPERIVVDANRLCQLVINLVGNATKFTDAGHILVGFSLSGAPSDDDQMMLRVSVRDTGPGIAAEHHESIFDQFTQTDGSLARRVGGSGLGLAICRNLVSLMGGHIWLESEVGKGSDFRFEIPVSAAAQQPQVDPSVLRGGRILLVDTNPASRDVMAQMLRSWQMDLTSCASADEANRLLAQSDAAGSPYRFVLWDARLGDETARLPQPSAGQLCSLIMLAPSAVVDGANEEAADRHFLSKPITPSELLEQLVACLATSERAPDPHEARHAPTAALNVLVVDDNEINREVARGMSESRGHRVWVAVDGFDALEQLRQRVFDCVLLDIQMPGLTGLEVLARFRETDHKHSPRFIAMTAHAMAGDRERYLEQGFHSYVAKPMTLSSLSAALDTVGPRSEENSTPAQAAELPYDPLAILQRAGGKPTRAARMCSILFRELDGHLDKIRAAMEDRNVEDLARGCHALAGMIGNFGSPAEPVARVMERMARDGDLKGAVGLLAALEYEAEATRVGLEKWVSTLEIPQPS